MASDSTERINPNVADKMRQLADLITSELSERTAARLALGFKCTVDYACTGQEFTCSTFRCPGSFKVKELRELESQ